MATRPKGVKGSAFRRDSELHLEDPYMLKGRYTDPTVCPKCGAAYIQKRWTFDKKSVEDAKRNRAKQSPCPACLKAKDGYAMGILYAEGDFVTTHRRDILNALRSEEKRAAMKNPLGRIIKIDETDNRLIFETTSEQLALRLGRFLKHAYSGNLDVKFSHHEKLIRIFWVRD